MQKYVLYICMLVIFVSFSPTAAAWLDYVEGNTTNFEMHRSQGCYLYHGNGMHLLFTSRDNFLPLRGIIRTNGRFINDRSLAFNADDSYIIRQDRHEISFSMRIGPNLKGINYHIDGSVSQPTMTVSLFTEGGFFAPEYVLIGPGGRNPTEMPFTLKRAW